MSIRNKRLQKELLVIDNLILEDNWKDQKIIIIKKIYKNTEFTIKIDEKYPFTFPKLYIHNTDYIDWVLKNNLNHIKQLFNINIPCICCNTITCIWTPTMGIKDIIKELETHYKEYYVLLQINAFYNKINNFDNLIYKHIFEFLYFNNI